MYILLFKCIISISKDIKKGYKEKDIKKRRERENLTEQKFFSYVNHVKRKS